MKKFLLLVLISSLILQGCSLPEISVMNIDGEMFYKHLVRIEKSLYTLERQYDIAGFEKRIEDTTNTYIEITLNNDSEYNFQKVSLKDSLITGKNETLVKEIKLSEIKFIQLYRASRSGETDQGWIYVISGILVGAGNDISRMKSGKGSFTGTIIGALIGFGLGSLFFFDKNKPTEKIYLNTKIMEFIR